MKVVRVSAVSGFKDKWLKGIREGGGASPSVESSVRAILKAVRLRGDRAVLQYTKKFDRAHFTSRQIRIKPSQIEAAYRKVPAPAVKALRFAARRIREFHERQRITGFKYKKNGILLGQMVRPLDRVGIYVPGGKAAYPSTVLMNSIPAKVAGVSEVVMCMPTPGGKINPILLVAADLAKVDEIYTVGGAQAIGALAFGTQTIRRVDKIVGPGNIYVATAKKQVFGTVDIDMIAGPSEIVVIADTSAKPRFVAADLLSQAEHDEDAISILITPSESVARAVQEEIKRQLPLLSRKKIIRASLKRNGRIFLVKNLHEATEISNAIAPEHLELAVRQPERLLSRIRNAGAVFLGHQTAEALGDYVAGPNHVLPTGGTARFFSPLSVDDFIKKTSLLSFQPKGLEYVKDAAILIAKMEGLQAHARAVEIRTQ